MTQKFMGTADELTQPLSYDGPWDEYDLQLRLLVGGTLGFLVFLKLLALLVHFEVLFVIPEIIFSVVTGIVVAVFWTVLQVFRIVFKATVLVIGITLIGSSTVIAYIFMIRLPVRFWRTADCYTLRDFIGALRIRRTYTSIIPLGKDQLSLSQNLLERFVVWLHNYSSPIIPGPAHNATVILIRDWLRNCQSEPALRECQLSSNTTSACPLYLIDVDQKCLVPYEAGMQFFALSYVWGQVDDAQAVKANFDLLSKPNALLNPGGFLNVPLTIRDAIALTGWLGTKYLWCDRLCIIQDDPLTKHKQIQTMARIYAGASCTIIAADNEDANTGLRGIPNLSGAGTISRRKRGTKGLYSSRVWTFQEELFSVRRLWLDHQAVYWECPTKQDRGWW